MNVLSSKAGKGLSLIEVLVGLAVLAVLAAFASPMLRDNSARVAVKEATMQVALALHKARNSARASKSDVTVLITTKPSGNTISFEFPNGHGREGIAPPLPLVTLPDTISITSDARSVTFSPQGTVDTTATIRLASAAGTDFFAKVMLKSLQGRVKTSYSLQAGTG